MDSRLATSPQPNARAEAGVELSNCSCCCGSTPPPETPAPATGGRAFRVRGLDCAEEVAILKRVIGPLIGGAEHLAFDALNGRMTLLPDAKPVDESEIRDAVARTGMSAEVWEPDSAEPIDDDGHRRRQIRATSLSGAFAAIGAGLHLALPGVPLAAVAAYALAVLFGVRYVLPKAWYAARNLRPDMNLLMVIAVAGAAGIGEWFEAASVSFLFALSLTLESWSVGRARRAISALLDLAPPTARVKGADGTEEAVPAADVAVGARFLVRPGERIPLDGIVAAGTSAVDQAPITGESLPAFKERGDAIFAGTINGDGVLEAECTKAANDTTLARIIRMVQEAHGRRARAEQWVEKFARVYTPAVILLATLIVLVPPLAWGGAWDAWFYRGLVLLVIACPCALVISTPVSIVAALAASARQGVLVKGGVYIELPARLDALAFDKTGTLTRGKPTVVAVVPLNGHTEDQLLERAAALEAHSNHPLAKAVSVLAGQRGIATAPAGDVTVLPGKGITGNFAGKPFWLGSHRLLAERGQETPEVAARAEALEQDGSTVVVIGNDDHVCGLLAVADTVRPEAAEAVAALRQRGVNHIVMLTGDNRATAEAIAREIGIDEVRAELLPEDKVHAIEDLVNRHGTVAMVGDGVNDAPAMARASLGIAMGAAGSDAAIETADVALMTDDLGRLPWLTGHAKRTLAVIRVNIAFSLAIKAAFVGLTVLGMATLWGAIVADVGTSLLVVANALRLLRT